MAHLKPDISSYLDANHYKISIDTSWENFRFACIDSEATGLDPRKDRLISIAGVGSQQGDICLWDQYFAIMPVAYNTSSVTVHGITKAEAANGIEEPEAIGKFLHWLHDGVIVGHHIQHDVTMLNIAVQRHFGCQMRNIVVDTMEMFHSIVAAGGFAAREMPDGYSLDALCAFFHIVPHDRHTATGDAYLTALILARLLKEAGRIGLWNFTNFKAWHADRCVAGN